MMDEVLEQMLRQEMNVRVGRIATALERIADALDNEGGNGYRSGTRASALIDSLPDIVPSPEAVRTSALNAATTARKKLADDDTRLYRCPFVAAGDPPFKQCTRYRSVETNGHVLFSPYGWVDDVSTSWPDHDFHA